MRAGLSTIQQTLTPEASAVLNRSIAEAARRNHGQTTPLHVAATLLSSPSGFLREACVKSHPNSSHPLQCRALELCFSVALDRLPSNPNGGAGGGGGAAANSNPPISNALMAALKRAQAHQRRGCPDQQQQPLLAVKVELEQLVVSILDDPSVSRVMREASFSSPAVKATIEQSMTASATTSSSSPSTASPTTATQTTNSMSVGVSGKLGLLGTRQIPTPLIPGNRNLYLNPRLQQQQQHQKSGAGLRSGGKEEEVKKVLDILKRAKKRNPVLVADPEPATLVREVVESIEKGKEGPQNVEVISVEEDFVSNRSQIVAKIKELGNSIEKRLLVREGVVLHLGDLKWLVEGPNGSNSGQIQPPPHQQQIVSEIGRSVVAEMARLIGRFADSGAGRLWVIGSASCATYLRCQVYHPTMENDWDLQAVPIAARAPAPGMFPRTGNNGILSSTVESLASAGKGFSTIPSTTLLSRRTFESKPTSIKTMCSVCDENYKKELAKLVADNNEKSSFNSRPEERRKALPQWLQAAKLSNESSTTEQQQATEQKQSTEELLNRWKATCSRLHPNPSPLLRQGLELKTTLLQGSNIPQATGYPKKPTVAIHGSSQRVSPPGSPVRTDLVLGRPNDSGTSILEHRIKDSGGCTPDFFLSQRDKLCGKSDSDSFKRLLKGLAEKVAWQTEAASAVAVTVHQCQSGNGKRRANSTKGDTWLMFMGPDKVGKRKLASALSELVFGTSSVNVSFGPPKREDGETNVRYRGRTAVDQVAEAVRQNPFGVFVLEDIDHADILVRSSLKRAIERGRLPDSHGREVSLTSSIFVITAESLPGSLRTEGMDSLIQCEEKLESVGNSGWQLELLVGDRTAKRKAEWLCEEGWLADRRKETGTGLSLDLNLAAGGVEEENGEGSRNSSDLTAEHEQEHECGRGNGLGRLALAMGQASPSPLLELIDAVDKAVVFKPVDFSALRRKVSDAVAGKFNSVLGSRGVLRLDAEALDRIVGGIWFKGRAEVFDEWTERVLTPSFAKLKSNFVGDDAPTTVKLLLVKDGGSPETAAALPSRITVSGVGVSEG